jgi:hypothetical protein
MKRNLAFTISILAILAVAGSLFYAYRERQPNPRRESEGTITNTRNVVENATIETISSSTTSTVPNEEFVKPLHLSNTYGIAGMLTVTGYLDLKPFLCRSFPQDGSESVATIECHSPYAYFRFTGTDNTLIYQLIKSAIRGESTTNALRAPSEIGLGCYIKDQNRIFAGNKDPYGNYINNITGDALQQLLEASRQNPITIELRATPSVGDSEDAACFADYEFLTVLDAPE